MGIKVYNWYKSEKGERKKMKRHKLGRPKGSKNKHPSKGKRNRVQKDIKEIKEQKHKKGYIPQVFPEVKPYKFLGYCECNSIISEKDLISKFLYYCCKCDKKARIKTLTSALNIARTDRKDDKEEIHRHIETLPLNDHIIDSKDFKVQE